MIRDWNGRNLGTLAVGLPLNDFHQPSPRSHSSHPQWHLAERAAMRWNQEIFGTVRDEDEREPWGNDVWRIDAALGHRLTDYLQLEAQYSLSRHDASFDPNEHVFATQLTLKY